MTVTADGPDGYRLRPAAVGDLARLADLCGQLGYPSSPEDLHRRLGGILHDGNHLVCVAVGPGGEVAGFVHAALRPLLEVDLHAEIGGLVVDRAHRHQGVGRALMAWAEQWARARGCAMVQLRSNVDREETPFFYRAIGYEEAKLSRTFRKGL
jgi:GNAT superfamily N-acetyltransferase